MTSLEKMIERIRLDTEAEKQKILANAQQQCEKIQAEAEQLSAAQTAEAAAECERKTQLLLASGESSAHKDGRNLLLQTRREWIDRAFAESLASLRALSGDALYAVLEQIVVRNAQPGEGVLFLSAEDLAAMPADFAARCSRQIENGSVTVSETCRNTQGGVILKYGDIEINCTFGEMLSAAREQLEDQVHAVLFA